MVAVIALSMVLVGSTGARSAGKEEWREVFPAEGEKVDVVIDEARRAYALLAPGKNAQVDVEGPARLRVRTRLLLGNNRKETYRYSVAVNGDDGVGERVFPLRCEVSRKANLVGTGGPRIGQAESFAFEVPAGQHRYRFSAQDPPGAKIAVRFYRRPQPQELTWETIVPVNHAGECDLVPRTRLTRYYALPQNETLRLRVGGPARLRIWSRLSFNESMMGDVPYSIQIVRDGTEAQVIALIGRKSTKSIYVERTDLIPAKAEILEFDVPEGSHEYRLRLTATSAPRVTLRFSRAEVR
ncbi:hypothetical protein AMJ39_08630 [candidate division TA06 bacterium DG_24]|uniref:Uncharacterized protein n=1 Tax=candidate division TA06 bacterium DG_24 TaxID=1703770 RepID=A0A0S7WPL3_UNCT6|nr:MAG: hypothetical protein AMJ39_08630 [candidate division TA06 bacterium DG_24]